MQSKTNPTLLEIACKFNHWFRETDPVCKLAQIQECGFSESYRGDIYDANGYLITENVLVEVEPAGSTGDLWPTIVVGDTVHRTLDFTAMTSDTLTGPGGWYVIVRSTEGGAE